MEHINPAIFCLLISLVGAFTQRISGFGYGIVVMMVYPFFLSVGESGALSGAVSLFSTFYVAYSLRKNIKIKQLWIPLITYTLTNYFATKFVAGADTSLLKRILGGSLMLLSIYFILFSKKIKIKPTPANGLIAGGLSGIMSGLFAMSGPPMVVYFLSTNSDNTDDYIATIQAFFALSGVIATATRAINGLYTKNVFILLIPAFFGMLFGNFIGRKTYNNLKPDTVKKCVYAFMALSGFISLIMG